MLMKKTLMSIKFNDWVFFTKAGPVALLFPDVCSRRPSVTCAVIGRFRRLLSGLCGFSTNSYEMLTIFKRFPRNQNVVTMATIATKNRRTSTLMIRFRHPWPHRSDGDARF